MAKTEDRKRHDNDLQRARSAAMTRLSRIYPEQYLKIHNEERVRLGLGPVGPSRNMSLEELAKMHGMKLVPIDA